MLSFLRTSRFGRCGLPTAFLVALAALGATGCTQRAQTELARRILEDHRARARVKPLPAADVVRLRLTSAPSDASGSETIEWDESNYRETVSSACWTKVCGIQAGKGYFTDEDGVTRLASEPLLSEFLTRSYFWRRAYLFDDQQRARLELGPADDATVSVRVKPRGGEPLLLTFTRPELRLLAARSRHLELVFSSPTRLRDSSRRELPVETEILWTGLPTGALEDTAVGGWTARWSGTPAPVPFARLGRAVTVPVRLSGQPATLAFDAAEDGPVRVRDSLAERLGLAFTRDIFGRRVARGARLEIGEVSFPSLVVEATASLPEGIDLAAGAALLRETVVEIDPEAGTLRLHDPARWVGPEGFFRTLIDDDGNRAVPILQRKGERLRLLGPTAAVGPLTLTPRASRRLRLSGQPLRIAGLHWGALLPELPVVVSSDSETDFDEDGRIGWDLTLQFHAFIDLPHRWVYLKPRS